MPAAARLAVGSVDFDHLGFEGFLGLAGACGLPCIELYPGSLGGLDEGGAAAALERRGVSVCCVNVTPRFALGGRGASTAECQTETIGRIRWAARLGAPFVNTYIGPYDGGPAAAQRRYREDVQPLLEAAAGAGVTVLVENLADPRDEDPRGEGPARGPESLLALAESVGEAPWGLTFDAANFRQAGFEGYPYAYRLLRPYIRHVHAKDSVRFSRALQGEPGDRRILRDSREGEFVGVAVGAGAVNFDGFFAELLRDGYSGHIVIEPHVCPREAEAVLRQGQAYIARRLGEG